MDVSKAVSQDKLEIDFSQREKIIETLEKYGVTLIPGYFDEAILEKLKKEFEQFISTPDTDYKRLTPYSDGKCARVKLQKLDTDLYSETADVFQSQFMDEIANSYFGHSEFDLNSEIFVVKDVVGSRHIANDLHFDIKPTFKFFVYLTDTTEENGAFSCVPGSHTKTQEIRERYGDKINSDNREITRDLPASQDEVIPIEGAAGTLIIFTTETFHKAGIVSKGERLVMRGHTRENITPNIINRVKKRIKNKFNAILNTN